MQRLVLNNKHALVCLFFLLSLIYSFNSKALSLSFNHILSDKLSNKWINTITLDNQGFLWLSSGSQIWRFDGYRLKSFDYIFNKANDKIKKIYIDKLSNLWVGTDTNGLYKYNIVNPTTKVYQTLGSNKITALMGDGNGGMWVGTSVGLNFISNKNNNVYHYLYIKDKAVSKLYITSILDYSKNELLIGTNKYLYLFNKTSHTFLKIQLLGNEPFVIYSLVTDSNNNIWVATQKGLFEKKSTEKKYNHFMPDVILGEIITVTTDKEGIWVGSYYNGIYYISNENKNIQNYKKDIINPLSISDNSITSILHNNNDLWVNTFKKGLNYIDTNTFAFGMENLTNNSVYCAPSETFLNLISSNNGVVWIATEKGIIKLNTQKGICENYSLDLKGKEVFISKMIMFATIDSSNSLWIATTRGLNKFNFTLEKIDTSYEKYINNFIFFIYELKKNLLLIGTDQGLYEFDIINKKTTKITSKNNQLNNSWFRSIVSAKKNNELYLATNNGVVLYKRGEQLIRHNKIQNQIPTDNVLSLFISESGFLWVGTAEDGVFRFNNKGSLVTVSNESSNTFKELSIRSFVEDNNHDIWMGTDNGLLKFDNLKNLLSLQHKNKGLQGEVFSLNAASKLPDGKLYFGGSNGYNHFYSRDIKSNKTPPNIVLVDFTHFGQSIQIGQEYDGFILEKPINELDELVLTYKDYVIGFEFSALDYADPSRNKYAYKMEGLNPDWTYVNADNRQISYSNLSSGEYTFRVKGSNKDGIWNQQGKSLKIIVKPAPWLSWWAYLLYALFSICTIFWYLKRKNQTNLRITSMLKSEVEKQTKELQVQKQTVETLLAKKNELFANVSHEFRTPLTLILGPINKLLNSHLPHSDINALKMVNRNANRLLTMIEQLLQIAKTTDFDRIQFEFINTKKHVENIVTSFAVSAKEKRIDLKLNDNDNACIKVSKDALDIILSNLLSNAIKYTPRGGSIEINATKVNNQFHLKVKDTGCGLDEKQQKEIFIRFKRLDSHQNIEGIGIGLSVVEELIKVNNATIEITSHLGAGSAFAVTFNCSDEEAREVDANTSNLLVNQLSNEVKQTREVEQTIEKIGNKRNETILIIEDNHDMRAHIADCLKQHYYCLLADRGKKGIALAIEHVPDIIICDVMMPKMDGFHVSRVLRSDGRTSHIPLMLLTALDDRESRIRGWREHVDVYITKPFDVQELLLQLENILVIRNILKEKNSQQVRAGRDALSTIDLQKKDREFVNKINVFIAKKYKNPLYLRAHLACDMAISERQLQRKLKALINKNPMGLLREYRLQQAAVLLKDGYQVSITSDECGFSSLPHFSKCFKTQFGMSPKLYQISCNKKM